MNTSSPRFILPLCAALVVGCMSDRATLPEAPRHVLTTVVVAPGEISITMDSAVSLTLDAWDQSGVRMPQAYPTELANKATWTSDDPKIATVSSTGIVTGFAPGRTTIYASLSVDGVSLSTSMTANVVQPNDSAVTVTETPDKRWSPTIVRIQAGGTVTWVIPSNVIPSTIWLNVWDDSAEKLVFTDGVVTRRFYERGTFFYGTGFGLMWNEEGGKIVVY